MKLRPLALFPLTLVVVAPLVGIAQESSPGRAAPPAASTALHASARTPVARHLSLPRWTPTNVDAVVPQVAPDVLCSLPQVIEGASQRVQELVANLEQFAATEEIEHDQLNKAGKPHARRARSYNYVVSIREIRPGMFSVDESRRGTPRPGASSDAFPTSLETTGGAALALIFHPYYLADFQMSCEGLGQWRGQPAWQVHFQQRPERPSRIRAYFVHNREFPVPLKGRAWIAAGTYHILHLETDLLQPVPPIRLETDHLAIEYRPVQFQKRNVELWLPESVDIYLDFNGHLYHHRHRFRDFMLFSVEDRQKIEEPRQP